MLHVAIPIRPRCTLRHAPRILLPRAHVARRLQALTIYTNVLKTRAHDPTVSAVASNNVISLKGADGFSGCPTTFVAPRQRPRSSQHSVLSPRRRREATFASAVVPMQASATFLTLSRSPRRRLPRRPSTCVRAACGVAWCTSRLDARDVAHRHCALGGRICRPGCYSRPSHAHGKCGCGRIMG